MKHKRPASTLTQWLVVLPLAGVLLWGSLLRVTHVHTHADSDAPGSWILHQGTLDQDVRVAAASVHGHACGASHRHLLNDEASPGRHDERDRPGSPAEHEDCAVCHYLAQAALADVPPTSTTGLDCCEQRVIVGSLSTPIFFVRVYSTRAPPLPA